MSSGNAAYVSSLFENEAWVAVLEVKRSYQVEVLIHHAPSKNGVGDLGRFLTTSSRETSLAINRTANRADRFSGRGPDLAIKACQNSVCRMNK